MSENQQKPIAAYAASLINSFRQVPPAAVPAMLDCVLASTDLLPSLLYSTILEAFPNLTEELVRESEALDSVQLYIQSFVVSLCHLLKKLGPDSGGLQAFIWKILVPLTKLVDAHEYKILNETADLFFDVVIQTNSWGIVESTLVPFFLRSVGLSMGLLQSEELDIYAWSRCSFTGSYGSNKIDSDMNKDVIISGSGSFSLYTVCHILTSILEISIQSQGAGGLSKSILTSGTLGENLLWDLCNMTVRMLSLSVEHRSCAMKLLLPVIFRVFVFHSAFKISFRGQTYMFSRKQFMRKVWTCCRMLFCLGSLERRDSYNILSLYVSSIPTSCGNSDDDSWDKEGFDIKSEKEFWNQMKKGLVDKESLVRKQSLHILKKLLNIDDGSQTYSALPETISSSVSDPLTKRGQYAVKEAKSMGVGNICGSLGPSLNSQKQWGSFFLLYEMLEEYGTHLVEAAWSHQINLLLSSSFPEEDFMHSVNGLLNEQEIETSEAVFNWLAILWERGFEHDNPIVRCLIMESFLGIEWNTYKYCSQLVPEGFVLGPFLQGLNDPVHHKDFGMKGIYRSRVIEGATIFIRQYASSLALRNRLGFLINLASSTKRLSFGRAGLMSLAECISSAANVISKNYIERTAHPSDERGHVPCTKENSSHNDRAELLDILRFTLESSKQHFNPKYRLQVCDRILDAAASVLDGTDVSLEILLHFISAVPREYTDCGGSLSSRIRKWISTGDEERCTTNCSGLSVTLFKELCNFPGCFISLPQSASMEMNYDDDDVDGWDSEARRWARVLFLVVNKDAHLDPLLTFFQTHFTSLFRQNSDVEAVHVKFLILVLSFVEELQIMHERVTETTKRDRSNSEISLVEIKIDLSLSKVRAVIDKFVELYCSALERLVSYAKSCCSIFWSDVVEDTDLSCSIRGKLGGPSQRRISPSTTTAVLRAINSVKAVVYISSWSVQYGSDDFVKLAFNFSWEFFWKINSLQHCESETMAEIWLAAYEALVHVLKAVASGFSLLALDAIMEDQIPSSLLEGRALLDSMVVPFLQKINSLITVEKLARSRRAVLMNLKWMCVEYLLTLPSNAVQKGVSLEDDNHFFSDATLRWISADLIDSLENAGEGSVLPMLRSIRLVLELLDSQKTHADISTSDSIEVQMMWSLVRASWIMHVSCKKRRVAPLAALLSSVLHYSLFSKESMHEFDNEPGPLKWFIEKLLEEGTKSPRTIRLAALHLTGLWISYPKTIKHYLKELKLLTLYGSVAFDEDFEGELAENYDARREVSLLAKSPDTELTEVFINTELFARVSVAVLFHKLADMANMIGTNDENENCHAALHSGKVFLQELLDSAINDKDLVRELYKKYSGVHRRKIRAWQMICILAQFVDKDLLEKVTSCLHTSLNRNNLPAVRQYLETFAINIYLRFPLLVTKQLAPIFRDYDMRPQALSSYVFIAANVILHAPASVQANHLGELFPPIVPLLTSHHHSLRAFTQLLVYQVLCKLLPSLDSSIYETMALEKRCLEDLRSYLSNNSDCTRLRASMEGYLDAFNPKDSITPAGIFSNRVEELEFECAPTSLMDQVTAFLNGVREDLRSSMARDAETIKNESLKFNEERSSTGMSEIADESNLQAQKPKDVLYDFQKKITISKCERQSEICDISGKTDTYKTLMEMEKEDRLLDELLLSKAIASNDIRRNRQHFILVASLIDRIPNLAGLARTCEVFKAAGMVVADANIVLDKQFQLISVTAEKWVPITEVPICNLIVYLQKKKREGYSILGLEQTANSIPLDQYTFPEKTVMVLGREKEGIPVEIIHNLDACIEIPQLGVVRSLNVHVSGAIALWECTRQGRRSQ